MKVDTKTLYKIYFTPEELRTMGTGYIAMYPASDMPWFRRQVINKRHAAGELSSWLKEAEKSAFDNVSTAGRDLHGALMSAVAHNEQALVTVGTMATE